MTQENELAIEPTEPPFTWVDDHNVGHAGCTLTPQSAISLANEMIIGLSDLLDKTMATISGMEIQINNLKECADLSDQCKHCFGDLESIKSESTEDYVDFCRACGVEVEA